MTPEEWERRLRWSATGHGWFARTDKVRIFVSWKVVADAAAQGHLLLDLEQYTLSRTLPLALLPPDAPVRVSSPLPDTLLPESETTREARWRRETMPSNVSHPSSFLVRPFDSHDQPPDQREGARPQVEVGEVSSFCSSFPPMVSAGPAAIHVKPRRLSRVPGPAR